MQHVNDPRPLREIATQFVDDATLLTRQEIELAKRELNEKVTALKLQALEAAAGASILLTGVILLALGLAYLLALALPLWLSTLIVGAAAAAAGSALTYKVAKDVRELDLTPRQARKNIRTDIQTIKEAAQ